ncbi:MAG: acyltransferase [Lachnospiraceae bacterium]|nr:acyltransferase [Lachnospiraceae bacterium]
MWTTYKRNNIQIVKAFATMAVILIHTTTFWPYDYVVFPFIAPCVGVFIFISGYLTRANIPDLPAFYKRRLVKVLIPYFICSILYCAMSHSWDNLIVRLLLGQCNLTYYYVFVFVQLIILTPLISRFVQSRWYVLLLFITPLAMLAEEILIRRGAWIVFPNNINNFFVWITYFAIGMRWRYLEDSDSVSEPGVSRAVAGAVVIIIGLVLQFIESRWWMDFGRNDLATSMVKISVFITIVGLCNVLYYYINVRESNGIIRRILKLVGDKAFELYLLHQFIIYIIGFFPTIYGLNPFIKMIIVLVVTLAAIYIIEGLYKMLRKIVAA